MEGVLLSASPSASAGVWNRKDAEVKKICWSEGDIVGSMETSGFAGYQIALLW